jgi:hypothetical protein
VLIHVKLSVEQLWEGPTQLLDVLSTRRQTEEEANPPSHCSLMRAQRPGSGAAGRATPYLLFGPHGPPPAVACIRKLEAARGTYRAIS